MVGDGNRTGPEEVTTAINGSLRSIDGQPVMGHMAQKLSMADRRKITQAMADGAPGPRMEEVGVTCTECGREGDYTVSWWISFVNDLTPFDLLYLQYQRIAERFPGWSLSEIKSMPFPERRHWIDVVLHQEK